MKGGSRRIEGQREDETEGVTQGTEVDRAVTKDDSLSIP